MATNGITQSVVVAIDPFVPTKKVLDTCAHLPDLLLPFGSCDPHNPAYQGNFAHLLTRPTAGLKFHAGLLETPWPSALHRLLSRFSTLTFVCDHSG